MQRAIGLLAKGLIVLAALHGCGRAPPSNPAGIGPDQVMIRLRCKASTPAAELPRRVYIFPPLRSDENGKPEQSFRSLEGRDGMMQWLPPDEQSARWLKFLQDIFTEKGYQSISYHDLARSGSDHEILVINAYYSRPYGIGQGHQTAQTLFTRISGATYPADLDPTGKRDRFLQLATAFFMMGGQAENVPPIAMAAAVHWIGSNGLIKGRFPLDIRAKDLIEAN